MILMHTLSLALSLALTVFQSSLGYLCPESSLLARIYLRGEGEGGKQTRGERIKTGKGEKEGRRGEGEGQRITLS